AVPRAAPRRPGGVARLAARPHLLPDRLPQSHRRDARVALALRHVPARRAAHHRRRRTRSDRRGAQGRVGSRRARDATLSDVSPPRIAAAGERRVPVLLVALSARRPRRLARRALPHPGRRLGRQGPEQTMTSRLASLTLALVLAAPSLALAQVA